GRRDSARHHILGRHTRLRESCRRLRDLPARCRRPLLRRTRHSTGHYVAPRSRDPQPVFRRRCPLPSPDGRRHSRRPHALRKRRHPRARSARPRRQTRPRETARVQRTLQAPRRLPLRSGSRPPRLDAYRSQRPLGRSQRRPPGFHPLLMNICGTSNKRSGPRGYPGRGSDHDARCSNPSRDREGAISPASHHPQPESPPIMLRNLLLIATLLVPLRAESGADAWLRYAPLDEASARPYRATLPAAVGSDTATPVARSAQDELRRGIRGMLGLTLRVQSALPMESAIVLGTLAELKHVAPQLRLEADLPPDAYWLTTASLNGVAYTVITAANDRGVLYGTFAFLRKIALGEPVAMLDEKRSPYNALRWVNEWNNLDGSI